MKWNVNNSIVSIGELSSGTLLVNGFELINLLIVTVHCSSPTCVISQFPALVQSLDLIRQRRILMRLSLGWMQGGSQL